MGQERTPGTPEKFKIETGTVIVVYDGTNMPDVHLAIDEALGVKGQNLAKGSLIIRNALHPDIKLSDVAPASPHVSK